VSKTTLSALLLAAVMLAACRGGGGGGNNSPPPNRGPIANAGPDQMAARSTEVVLAGNGSSDPDGTIQAYDWMQLSGPAVVLDDAAAVSTSFTSPFVSTETDLVFELTVTDDDGAAATDTVTVTVVPELFVTVSGTITFDYVPVVAVVNTRLDYSNTEARPARGVTVQLIDASDSSVIETVATDENGGYSFTVGSNLPVFLRVRAEMLQASPSWNVRVVDNTQGNALYVMDGSQFDTGNSDSTQNLRADSGWTGASYGNPRVAAPFAILDVVYDAVHLVSGVDPTISFPALVIYWSRDNVTTLGVDGPDPETGEIGGSFYRSGPTESDLGIYLLGEEDEDTDEYDRHVIAHEWGHYLEANFSRSDNIGGPHGYGDQLDMRVAFSEGLGNALSGMIMGNRIYADTSGSAQSLGFSVDLEDTPSPNPGWYSEFSIQEILYDLFDPANDDPLALGFGPIYDVLVGPAADTTALASIFSFIDALKDSDSSLVADVDAIVAGHSITVIEDEYGSNETNAGNPPSADVLPVYGLLTVNGGAVNVCSTDEFTSGSGAVNKLGSRRYLRFTAASSASYTVTATTTLAPAATIPDPDMWLHRAGSLLVSQDPPPPDCDDANLGNCVETFGIGLDPGDYVLEVYEWTNTNAEDDPDYPPIGRTCFDVEVTSP
jgi:hypothetical protein